MKTTFLCSHTVTIILSHERVSVWAIWIQTKDIVML